MIYYLKNNDKKRGFTLCYKTKKRKIPAKKMVEFVMKEKKKSIYINLIHLSI